MDGGVPLGAIGARLAFVREGFTPLGASDDVIEIAPDGWLEADDLIGEYRVRVDEPQRWTVTVRRRSLRVTNDRLVIRNADSRRGRNHHQSALSLLRASDRPAAVANGHTVANADAPSEASCRIRR